MFVLYSRYKINNTFYLIEKLQKEQTKISKIKKKKRKIREKQIFLNVSFILDVLVNVSIM